MKPDAMGWCIGISRGEQLTLRDLVAGLRLESETTRFEGSLRYVTEGEPGEPETWRILGPYTGQCSPIIVVENVRFLLGDPRIVRVRVLKHGVETPPP